MRAGLLRHRGEIIGVGRAWFGLIEKAASTDNAIAGLRVASFVELRARADTPLSPMSHVRIGARLFVVMFPRAIPGGQAAAVVELVGQPARYLPRAGQPVPTRCHVQRDAVLVGENNSRVVYRARLEVPLIECPRPQPGDKIEVGGVVYIVSALAHDGDDGIVRSVWGDARKAIDED